MMLACMCIPQVLGIDGRHKECLLRYARLLLQAGQHDAALKQAQQATSFHPRDYAAAKLHADALRCAGHSVPASLPRVWILHAVSACSRCGQHTCQDISCLSSTESQGV